MRCLKWHVSLKHCKCSLTTCHRLISNVFRTSLYCSYTKLHVFFQLYLWGGTLWEKSFFEGGSLEIIELERMDRAKVLWRHNQFYQPTLHEKKLRDPYITKKVVLYYPRGGLGRLPVSRILLFRTIALWVAHTCGWIQDGRCRSKRRF